MSVSLSPTIRVPSAVSWFTAEPKGCATTLVDELDEFAELGVALVLLGLAFLWQAFREFSEFARESEGAVTAASGPRPCATDTPDDPATEEPVGRDRRPEETLDRGGVGERLVGAGLVVRS